MGSLGLSTGPGVPISLLEFAPSGALGQTINIPSGTNGLDLSGSATSEGSLSLSADGHSLAFAGYVNAYGVEPLSTTTAASQPRGYASIDYTGTYHYGGTFGFLGYDQNNIRGAATDGTHFWAPVRPRAAVSAAH